MKEARKELRASESEREDPPDFEGLVPPAELVRGERTRDDFLDVVLGLTEPATVTEVATLADHGKDAAREYLEWFERLGIVIQVTEKPATYRCNREYLRWRQVQKLREEYGSEELLAHLKTANERDEEFSAAFGVETPADISLTQYADKTNQSIEEVWQAVVEWKTTKRQIGLLERALSPSTDRLTGHGHPPA